jgi:hypothetical protein
MLRIDAFLILYENIKTAQHRNLYKNADTILILIFNFHANQKQI